MSKNRRLYYATGKVVHVEKEEKKSFVAPSAYIQLYHGAYEAMSFFSIKRTYAFLFFVIEKTKNGIYQSSAVSCEEFSQSQQQYLNQAVSLRQYAKLLKELTQRKILVKKSRGIYLINPYLFWKGSCKSREEVLIQIEKSGEKEKYVIDLPKKATIAVAKGSQ